MDNNVADLPLQTLSERLFHRRVMTQEIRPDYYQSCGNIGRTILCGWLPSEFFYKECCYAIDATGNDYHLGTAIAYLFRAGKKGDAADTRKDLMKARTHLGFYKDRCVLPVGIDGLIENIDGIIEDLSHAD